MKKLLSLVLFLFCLNLFAEEKISIRADEWMPFNGQPNAADQGYFIEVLKKIFEKKGIKIDYQIMPWKRSIEEAGKGSIDAIIGASEDEAKGLIIPKEEFIMTDNTFWVKKGSTWKYTDMKSVESVNIAVIEGYNYFDALDKYIEKNKGTQKVQVAVGDDPNEMNVKKLIAGRIDVIVEATPVMRWKLKMMKKDSEVVEAGDSKTPMTLFIAFSSKNPNSKKWAQIFDEGMKELRKSGELKKLLQKYKINDWKK